MTLTSGAVPRMGDFSLAYFSDGPSVNCGTTTYPSYLRSPSLILSDGNIYGTLSINQQCAWIINPEPLAPAGSSLIFEFFKNDIRGAKMYIYDGVDTSGSLLWSCDCCEVVPGPIISSTGKFYVTYTSIYPAKQSVLGSGFRAFYWVMKSHSTWVDSSKGLILEIPYSDSSDTFVGKNSTWAFSLTSSSSISQLSYSPAIDFVITKSGNDLEPLVIDGRPASDNELFKSLDLTRSICGISVVPGGLLSNHENILYF
jgi:hypothetical protein